LLGYSSEAFADGLQVARWCNAPPIRRVGLLSIDDGVERRLNVVDVDKEAPILCEVACDFKVF
jgi:hypothetical protein